MVMLRTAYYHTLIFAAVSNMHIVLSIFQQEHAEILHSVSRFNFYKININEYKTTNIPLTVTNLADCLNESYKK